MEDGSWKHFEFQSKNEGLAGLKRFRTYEALTSYQHKVPITTYVLFSGNIKNPITSFSEGINTYKVAPIIMKLMADKFLEPAELNKLKEEIHMTQLGQMLVDWDIEQGLEKGIEQGIQKGAKQKTQEFIINALKLGLSDEDILRLTECTPDELQAAREHWLSR